MGRHCVKNQDVTIKVLKFIHKEGKATRIEVNEWLKKQGVDIEDEHVVFQISEVFSRMTGLTSSIGEDKNVHVLRASAHFALLNYYNYKQAQKDSESAEIHSKKAIRLSIYALCISAGLAICSIFISVCSFFHTPTVKIYKEESFSEKAKTSDNKPIIKPTPNMPERE